RRHVGATDLIVERCIKRQGPSVLQVSQHIGQAFEPCLTLRRLAATNREPTWDSQGHGFHCSGFTGCVSSISEMWFAPVARCERMGNPDVIRVRRLVVGSRDLSVHFPVYMVYP